MASLSLPGRVLRWVICQKRSCGVRCMQSFESVPDWQQGPDPRHCHPAPLHDRNSTAYCSRAGSPPMPPHLQDPSAQARAVHTA